MPKQMTKAERAAYMRDYRARKKTASDGAGSAQPETPPDSIPAVSAPGPVATPDPVLPSFLAAPDDDCLACGHDQQTYHLAGPCAFPVGRRQTCGCPAFVVAF